MAKFNVGGTQAGQLSDLQKQSIVDLPVGQPETEAAPTGSIFDDVQPAVDAGVEAAVEKQAAVDAEVERQRVPTLQERGAAPVEPEWTPPAATPSRPTADPDGGYKARMKKMIDTFAGPEATQQLGITPTTPESRQAAHDQEYQTIADIEYGAQPGSLIGTFNALGAVKSSQDPETRAWSNEIDPVFLATASAVTENQMANLLFGEDTEADFTDETAQVEQNQDVQVTRAQGNVQLGQEIAREYQRLQNAMADQPTDQYQDLDRQAAGTLGAAAKEMYARANPDMVTKVPVGDQVAYKPTALGIELLKKGAPDRKRLFPKHNIRPQKTPTGGSLAGEVGRVAKRGRKVSGKIGKKLVGAETLVAATKNLAEVANVVDPQRMQVMFATILPVLKGDLDRNTWQAEINNVGSSTFNKMAASNPDGAQASYEQELRKVAGQVRSIAQERKGANFLTYYIQSFNGRIAPQQTTFDPTTSKAVRFVTRNAIPAKATPGSRIDRNLRQMYAMMLVDGADSALPNRREVELQRNERKLERWGDELAAALEAALPAGQVEAVAAAIEAGTPLNDPSFPQVQALQVSDPELQAMIEKKGEDGPHFIDGLIDFAKYAKARRAGKPYHSYFNAYIDGKTNGIASNGIQMGHIPTAQATGVLRTQNRRLLDDGDIRDELKRILLDDLRNYGFDGHVSEDVAPFLTAVAEKVFGFRDLNKATTMTFGYGKEMDSFKEDLMTTINLISQTDPEFKVNAEIVGQKMGTDAMVLAMLNKYKQSLAQVLSPEAVASRDIMKSAATLVGILDELFSITGPTGFELNLGADVSSGMFEEATTFTIGETGAKKRQVKVPHYESRPTASAVRMRDGRAVPGNHAYGGSVPAPVQSLDAATVAKTASGRSWNRLKDASQGAPYMHTIYDAFKMDAMGYDVILEEVNKNWLDLSMEWSYLKETREALKRISDDGVKKLDEMGNQNVDTTINGPYNMFDFYLAKYPSDKGTPGMWTLFKLFKKILDDPDNAYAAMNNVERKVKDAGWDPNKPATAKHVKAFYLAMRDELQVEQRLDRMIKRTEAAKADLKKEIKKGGQAVLQYYSH